MSSVIEGALSFTLTSDASLEVRLAGAWRLRGGLPSASLPSQLSRLPAATLSLPDRALFEILHLVGACAGGRSCTKRIEQPGENVLGVDPIKFPGYLDRQELVVRSAQNRFEVSENDR